MTISYRKSSLRTLRKALPHHQRGVLTVSGNFMYLVGSNIQLHWRKIKIWNLTTKFRNVNMKSLSRVQLFVTPWSVAYHSPPPMEFSRQEYWSGLPFLSPGDLSNPALNPGLSHCKQMLYWLSHQGRNLGKGSFKFITNHHQKYKIPCQITAKYMYTV